MLLTAPHTITTYRDGEEHAKEVNIDAMFDSLSAMGYDVMYNTTDTLDPNWHEESEFRQSTLRNQKYNIDIHGMSDSHGYNINIGTAGKTYDLSGIQSYCDDNGLLLDINGLFTGGGRTITAMHSDNGVRAIQIELSYSTRQMADIDIHIKNIVDSFVSTNQA